MILKTRRSVGPLVVTAILGFALTRSGALPGLIAQTSAAPGGFLEASATTVIRPKVTGSSAQAFLPGRGPFTFPSPYNTQGVRLTNGSDCAGGADCVQYVGYSYWSNINNHAASSDMFIFLGMNRQKGGVGPSLFSYNKVTGQTVNLGALFDSSSAWSWASGEGWYFSATLPTKMYVALPTGSQFFRYDVLARTFEPIFDVAPQYGADKYIWQLHSSSDDRVHSFTLRTNTTYAMLGCGAYREDTKQWFYFPARGDFDECQIDKSGRYLVIKENVDGLYGEDNVVEDLQTGTEQILLDQNGAAGHSDMGYGYMAAEDNFFSQPSAVRLWNLGADLNSPANGTLVSVGSSWYASSNHISHGNAVSTLAPSQQYVCSSQANRLDLPHSNEVVCYMLNGNLQDLIVAPVMTDLDAAGGGDDYGKDPKGNLDPTGQYIIWTSNTGGARLDAFIARVPSQLLVGSAPAPDTAAPAVAIGTPAMGAIVSGVTTVLASASDNVGVAGVQFTIDGVNLGPEIVAAPYGVSWTTTASPDGAHTLGAIARDAAGNRAISAPVAVTVQNGAVAALTVSNVATGSLSSGSASIGWSTNLAADSQVDYGTTTAYGTSTTIDSTMVTLHSQGLGGLSANTTYHYRVRSRSSDGSVATSSDAAFTTSASGSTPLAATPVIWTSLVNTTQTVGLLTKTTGCDGCQDAGAVSQQQITSGDGYLEFRIAETDTFRFAGLSNGNPGTTGNEIRFAFRLQSGVAEVRESGTYRAETPIVVGDLLRVAVVGGQVQYSKNGALIYSSALAPAYPLLVDTMLAGLGGTIAGAVISTPPPPPTTAPVVWTNKVNVTISATTLKKTGGCNGCQDAGATSVQQILTGDGYFEFTIDDANTFRAAGLSNGNPGTSGDEIKFAWRLQSGRAEIRESGVYRADTSIKKGDVLRVAVVNGRVVYSKNKVVIYTSTLVPAYPLLVDTMLAGLNGTISKAVISGSLGG